jgi:hypothetical protein
MDTQTALILNQESFAPPHVHTHEQSLNDRSAVLCC